MKQKSSRVLTEKTENASAGNAQAQGENVLRLKASTENGSGEIKQRLTRGARMSGLKARRRPKTAVDAGVEPRRVRRNGGYQELQCLLPRRWVVDSSNGEHHVDGDTISGGRRLG